MSFATPFAALQGVPPSCRTLLRLVDRIDREGGRVADGGNLVLQRDFFESWEGRAGGVAQLSQAEHCRSANLPTVAAERSDQRIDGGGTDGDKLAGDDVPLVRVGELLDELCRIARGGLIRRR